MAANLLPEIFFNAAGRQPGEVRHGLSPTITIVNQPVDRTQQHMAEARPVQSHLIAENTQYVVPRITHGTEPTAEHIFHYFPWLVDLVEARSASRILPRYVITTFPIYVKNR